MVADGDGGGQGKRGRLRIERERVDLIRVRRDEDAVDHLARAGRRLAQVAGFLSEGGSAVRVGKMLIRQLARRTVAEECPQRLISMSTETAVSWWIVLGIGKGPLRGHWRKVQNNCGHGVQTRVELRPFPSRETPTAMPPRKLRYANHPFRRFSMRISYLGIRPPKVQL